jgi:hypothetical protein
VSNRPELKSDEVVKLVAPAGSGCQPEPPFRGDLFHCVVEGDSRQVVAFVDEDQTVLTGHLGDVIRTRQGLQRHDVDDAADLVPTTATLTCFHAKQLANPGAPLVGEGLAIDEDQR